MQLIQELAVALRAGVPALAVVTAVIAVLLVTRFLLARRYADTPDTSFGIQIAMLALSLVGLVAVVMALPMSESLRGQLLGLTGILLSAAIALSATTFLGNILAGVLLRVVGGFRIGDFVRVGEHFGRVSERGLFHSEIQTQDRDLTTLPNLFLITHPVTVLRSSGTIVSVQLSLGYDVPRRRVERLLAEAAAKAGLVEPFVHIVEGGDFAVTYRVAGLLEDVKQILSARSTLWGAVIDALHGAGIEIVSPSFMNTRALAHGVRVIPRDDGVEAPAPIATSAVPERIVFDKADAAESLEHDKERCEELQAQIHDAELRLEATDDVDERERIVAEMAAAKAEHERLAAVIEATNIDDEP